MSQNSQHPCFPPTVSSSDSSVYDQVQEFFRFRPPGLIAALGATDSKNTRPPGPFDKHFPDFLRLKRVVKLPSIPSDLTDIAERSLDSYQGDLPPINSKFPTQRRCSNRLVYSCQEDIFCEKGVGGFYSATTAKCCEVVAGTLAFNLREWSPGCLRWALSEISKEKKEGVKRNQAVADGFLNAVGVDSEGKPLDLSDLVKDVIEKFPVLLPWEFKNLNFSERGALLGEVVNCFLDAPFPWEGCEFREACSITHDVGYRGARMGYDAENHPCPSFRVARDTRAQKSQEPLPEVSNFEELLKTFPKISRCVLQQAWSEAVRHDATFIVIQAGNLEIICIRDRRNQTLYISDVIDVTNCDYGKLHIGLYIAAIRDAEDRTMQLKKSMPATWVMKFGIPVDKRIDLTGKPREAVRQILWREACARRWLKILPDPKGESAKYHPYMTDHLYLRDLPHGSSEPLQIPDTNTFFRLLASSTFDGHTICRATIDLPGAILTDYQKSERFKLNKTVILKNASRPREISRLEKEYLVYLELHKVGVVNIPKVFGFFRGSDKEDDTRSFAVLVMEDMGQSLEQLQKEGGRVCVTQRQITLFENILKKIHEGNFAYGTLTAKNLMFRHGSDSAHVSIVGFGDTEPLPHRLVPVSFDQIDTLVSPAITSQREILIRRDFAALLNCCAIPKTIPLKRKVDDRKPYGLDSRGLVKTERQPQVAGVRLTRSLF